MVTPTATLLTMTTQHPVCALATRFASAIVLTSLVGFAPSTQGQAATRWEAFHDYRPLDGVTHPNASAFDLRVTDEGGFLRDIQTGADLPVSLRVVVEGDATPDDFGANSNVNPGTPADVLFGGKVVIGGADNPGLPGVRNSALTRLIINVEGLDPSKRYNFRGTVCRGGSYNDRWSVFTIEGADAFVDAHQDGSDNLNIFTKASFPAGTLEPNQVALNTGENKVGSLVGWDNIEPGPDGTFAVAAQQYVGPAPFGNPSAAAYGYGLNALYLAEIESTGALRITGNPASQLVPAGTAATLSVTATSPQAITYQWQQAAPGSATFTDVGGATAASYTTPLLTVAEDGVRYRCHLTSGTSAATSAEAVINVDGSIPTATAVRGSINFNAVHVTFSEAMKLDQLATAANYEITGLTVSSAVALDTTSVRLLTSTQAVGTRYTLRISNVEDRAGNKIAAATSVPFSSFSMQTGVVGVEIWRTIGGGTAQDLRNDARYPDQPDVDYATTTLDSLLVVPAVPDQNTYGGRFRAWLTPEESGDYEFFLSCDDGGEFRISMDDTFDNLDNPDIPPDAVDSTADNVFQESGWDLSTSWPIALERGKRYAIQAIWKESNGSDYGRVAWRRAGDFTPADQLPTIPSRFLSYYGPTAAPPEEPTITRIALQGGNVVVEWTGSSLESSSDLKTWSEEAGAAKPFSTAPNQAARFYRARD